MRIAHVMPVNTSEERKRTVKKRLQSIVSNETTVDVIDYKNGPIDLEYYHADAQAVHLMLEDIDRLSSYDAISIACFYDPGLRELRELLEIPVVGIGMASMNLASLLGYKFSVIVGRKKWIPKMMDNSIIYGYHTRIASWRSIDVTVEQMKENPELAYSRILEESRKAIEDDMAEVIVLGCAALDQLEEKLQQELQVPVINPIFAGIKVAEMLAHLKNKLNLSISKIYDYEISR